MFHHLGRFTARYPWTICFVWVLLGIILAKTAPVWDSQTQDDDVRFVPNRFTSVRAYQLLEKAFPDDVNACRIVFALERENRPLSDADLALLPEVQADLERLRQDKPYLKIGKIETCHDELIGVRLLSRDRHCTLLQVSLGTPYLAEATQAAVAESEAVVRKRLSTQANPPKVYATGAAGVGRDLTSVAGKSLDGTTWATILLVVVVLLGVYRAPLLALIPLATIALSVWVSMNVLAFLSLIPGIHLVSVSKLFAVVILYGAGTDYCLFLVSRYREELTNGHNIPDAIERGVGGVGEALAASAGTVMVALGLMIVAEFGKVRFAGPAIALSLGIALAASLTLTPALLKILGNVVFWPGKAPLPSARTLLLRKLNREKPAFWDRVSFLVQRRPLTTWILSTAFLLPLVYLGFKIEPNYRATSELSNASQSLQGLDAIQRHFTAGETGPVTVLLVSDQSWEGDDGLMQIGQLTHGFLALDNVAEVRSLLQPMGFPLIPLPYPSSEPESLIQEVLLFLHPFFGEVQNECQRVAKKRYLSSFEEDGKTRNVMRMDVVLKTDPFGPESAATYRLIQGWVERELPQTAFLKGPMQGECYGITAAALDLEDVTESDRLRVNGSVLVAIFLILLFLVRKLGMALYLLLTVSASYYAALGATMLAGILWTGHPLETVDWKVPFFLFTILVAVGEDYNILLVCRALQERKRHGSVEGMRIALARTGGAITSCGLIMAGTFATLMFAGLNTLLQVGCSLAFGVLIDTFVVRPFLVPAFAMMVWKEAPEPEKEKPRKKNPKKEALDRILREDWLEAA